MVASGALIGVTGATGRIGRLFCREAVRRGYRVRGFARLPGTLGEGVEVQPLDLHGQDGLDAGLFRDCAAVIHLAAYIPADHNSLAEAERCWSINALGTVRLVRALSSAGVGHLIQTCSANAYAPAQHCPDELAALYPQSRTFYLSSKIAQELCAGEASRTAGLPLATLRLSSVYGTGGAGDLVSHFAAQLLAGRTLTLNADGAYGADFVLADDVVSALFLVLEQGWEGVLNVASGHRTTLSDLADNLLALTGIASRLVRRLASDGAADHGFPAIAIDRARALGFCPTELAAGLAAVIRRQSDSESIA